jgi:hypothetical protein
MNLKFLFATYIFNEHSYTEQIDKGDLISYGFNFLLQISDIK